MSICNIDSSCSRFVQFNRLSIKDRIRYYLGSLYYEDTVYVDDLITIKDIEKDKSLIKAADIYLYDLKFILNKYSFHNKKFIHRFGDIQWKINDYMLVKNRYINSYGKSIIIRNLDYSRHWGHFYKIKDSILFENKIEKVFWRGSTTGEPNKPGNRFTLVEQYYNKYKDIDVAFSNICQGKDKYNKYLAHIPRWVSISYFLKYKYILSIEGNDKDSGINWKLASNSLVLMAKPRAFSWLMEDMLVPDYHYILLKDDFSDLREKVDWCNQHQEEVKQIIKNANEYMEMFRNIKQEEYIEKEVLRLYFEKVKSR